MDYIETPYYRTLSELNPGPTSGKTSDRYPNSKIRPLTQVNYRPYQLFALRTRLQPLIDRRYGLLKKKINGREIPGSAKYIVRYDRRRIKNRLMVVVVLFRTVDFAKYSFGPDTYGNGEGSESPKPMILSKEQRHFLQTAVDKIIGSEPNLSLLISSDTRFQSNFKGSFSRRRSDGANNRDQKLISGCWSAKMIRHLSLSHYLRPHIRENTEYQVGGLYVDLTRMVNFRLAYENLDMTITEKINQLYQDGFVILPKSFNPQKLKDWETSQYGKIADFTESETLDRDRNILFRARWYDRRLTDPVGGLVPFLQKHLVRGSKKVLLDIGGTNPIIRHRVTKTLRGYFTVQEYRFRNRWIEIKTDNLKIAQLAATLIQKSKLMPVGKVLVMYGSDPRQFNTFITMFPISNSKLNVELMGYRTDDLHFNHCLSCHIPYSADPAYYHRALNDWYRKEINGETVVPLVIGRKIKTQERVKIPTVIEGKVEELPEKPTKKPTKKLIKRLTEKQIPKINIERPRIKIPKMTFPTRKPIVVGESAVGSPLSSILSRIGIPTAVGVAA